MNANWNSLAGRLLVIGLTVAFLIACGGGANAPVATATPQPAVATDTPTPQATPTPQPATPAAIAITIGVNAQFKPFVYQDEAGMITGFDIELIEALARAGGFEVGFVDLPFEALLAGVANGEIDAAISALTITEERQARMAFTEPYFGQGQATVSYFNGGQGLAVRTDNTTITATTALTAETQIGVKEGTTGATYVISQTVAQAVSFPEAEPALAALSNGEVAAVVLDIPVIVNYIKNNPTAGIKLAGPPITEEQYAIAVNPAKPDVLTMLNAALAKIREDGTYDAIFQRWFGAP